MNLRRRSLADRDSLGVSLRGLCAAWSSGQQALGPRARPPLLLLLVGLFLLVPSSLLSFESGRTEYKAQQATKVWRIGYLGYDYPTEARNLEAFRQRLRDLGYVEGKNLVIESRSAESSVPRLPALAAELVSLKVDVIAAVSNPAIMALRRATHTIPIVMIIAGDPVGTGLVSSLAHPGGNVTGLSTLGEEMSAKWLELLTQTVPA